VGAGAFAVFGALLRGLGLGLRGFLALARLLLLFGGAVLTRAFTGVSLGWTAPAGGILLMAGWLLVAATALRR